MSLRQKYLKVLGELVPVGATSISLVLGSTAMGAARTNPPQILNDEASVSERLAAIREAVSDIAQSDPTQAERVPGVRLAKDLGSGSKIQQSTKPPTTTTTQRTGGGSSGGSAAPNYNPWNNWRNVRTHGNWFRNW